MSLCYNGKMKKHDEEKNKEIADETAQPNSGEDLKAADYLRAVKTELRDGNQKEAFRILQQASLHFPDQPLIRSYYGCLQSVVDKKYRSGIDNCKKAIADLRQRESFDGEVLFPVLFLNLGRACVAAGKKKEAVDSFNKGLKYDNGNRELLKELRGLGERKQPPVPFLDRSNPINKYIGMILHAGKKAPVKSRGKGAR
jgi:tetratricopeptide (TPR) repeat protein